MQASALAQTPRLLTTPLQAELVVLVLELLRDEELDVVVSSADEDVTRVNPVDVAGCSIGSTSCVVAQVTTPNKVEQDAVA